MRFGDRIIEQISMKLFSGIVQFNFFNFANLTTFDVSVNRFLLTLLWLIVFRLRSSFLSLPLELQSRNYQVTSTSRHKIQNSYLTVVNPLGLFNVLFALCSFFD